MDMYEFMGQVAVKAVEFGVLFFLFKVSFLRLFKKMVEGEVESVKLAATEVRLGLEVLRDQERSGMDRLDKISKAIEIIRVRLLDVEAKVRTQKIKKSSK